ncbi:MAG TPA: hypothetical protein VEF04_04575, partial [Blastocatellia bacterium]|nr:hypothetical protein [Blastocatellia bacterium]
MSNHKLDNISREEIRRAVEGLSQPMLKATVKELAERYEVSEKSIYAMTKDLRPQRKKRTDAGKRKADLLEDDGLKFAAMLVTNTHCRPEDALETARINGHEIKVSLATFQKYLREI